MRQERKETEAAVAHDATPVALRPRGTGAAP
jgi:hypothetical protein